MITVPPVDLMDITREPSDEELGALMAAVAETARQRSQEAKAKLTHSIRTEIGSIRRRWTYKASPRIRDRKRALLVVVAGPSDAGKTTFTNELLRYSSVGGGPYINPDEEQIRWELLSRKQSFACETGLSGPSELEFLRLASDAGYFVIFFYVSTDGPNISASRAASRVQRGGHSNPIEKIISLYEKSMAQAAIALTFVDRGYVYDNSVDNGPMTLLFRTIGGRVHRVYSRSQREWVQPLLEAIPGAPRGEN